MPIILAQLLRTVIMALVSGTSVTLIQEIVDGTFKTLITEIQSEGGLSTEEARDIIVNILVDLALNSAMIGVVLKTKLAVKTVERLGLTSKGLSKRTLTPKATEVAGKLAGPAGVAVGMSMVKKVIIAVSGIGSVIWLISAVANIIEPGIYQPVQTNAVYKALGIPFQYPVTPGQLQPGPFDIAGFKDYAVALEKAGIKGINNPVAKQSQMYSRQALADVINYVYGQEVLKGNSLSKAKLIPFLAPYLIGVEGVAPTVTQVAAATYIAPTVPQVHVFSGVVSSGIVGATAIFTARPDDLIENAEELTTASHNNLAPFIAAIGNRLSYTIKIVPSVKSASGFTQRGTVQKIISGYNKNGTPKYRQVVNKFAVMDIYVKTDKGSQAHITTIVLGPVDSVKFQAANVDMTAVASSVQQNIIAPASVITPTSTPAMVPIVPIHATGVFLSKNDPIWGTLYKLVNGSRWAYSPWPDLYTQDEINKSSADPGKFGPNEQKLKNAGVITSEAVIVPFIADRQPGETGEYRAIKTFAEFFGTPPSAGVVAPVVAPVAAQATTLFEYYQAHGQSLPSVEERSKLYEQLALGQAAYYTGTAEQNTKLLAALQGARL